MPREVIESTSRHGRAGCHGVLTVLCAYAYVFAEAEGNRDMNSSNNTDREDENNSGVWGVAGAVAAGVAALAGGIYWMIRGSSQNEQQSAPVHRRQQQSAPTAPTEPPPPSQSRDANRSAPAHDSASTWASYLTNFINHLSEARGDSASGEGRTRTRTRTRSSATRGVLAGGTAPPSNLNALLSDIFLNYIQLKHEDFKLHYRVFDRIFHELHQKMKEVDPYYGRYSSTVQFAGSHYDNLRINKPDEFDMDIVIDLPLNLRENPLNPRGSDISIEPMSAGFLQLRMGEQFQKLPMRDGNDWQINRAAYQWLGSNNYLLRSKFLDWFKGVVDRALNASRAHGISLPTYYVDGVPYTTVRKSESGPAITLLIENGPRGFRMDVDLVPALKFPEDRWPIGPSYRRIPDNCRKGYWMVVGKPNKNAANDHERTRSWRISLQNQERELMHGTNHLRQTVRLIKKLRDAQGMNQIASYYIKTLFLWEIIDQNEGFWSKNNPTQLFKIMVRRLHAAVVKGRIPYFWNKGNNLLGNVSRNTLDQYAAKLLPLVKILESEGAHNPLYKQVATFLLTPAEYNQYRPMLDN